MISEEHLTLYYYNDGLSDSERRAIEQALRDDAVLAARFSELRRQLENLPRADRIAAPTHFVQRLHDSIDRAARQEQRTTRGNRARSVHPMSFFWGAAVTAALAVGIGIGYWFSHDPTFTSAPAGAAMEIPQANLPVVPVAFHRGLQVHLQESQWEIANMSVDDQAQRAFLTARLIEQNRFFERTAALNNAPELARVLRGIEPVLQRLGSSDISEQDAIALREKLRFEISVMLTKISRNTSEDARTI